MIEALLIGFALFTGATVLAYLWLVSKFMTPRVDDREWLRRQIELAERRHEKRSHLRKRHVEATCRELQS